jgi:hypothetical protein
VTTKPPTAEDLERWGQQYRCGCFLGFPTKKSIPNHCPQHLRDRQGQPHRLINQEFNK